MSKGERSHRVLLPSEQVWRESKIMRIPNTNLLEHLGGSAPMGGRMWRLPPFSANTLHRHVAQWELYVVLEGIGRMRVAGETLTVPRHGCVLVAPDEMRQVFNDTADEVLWLIVGAPPDAVQGRPLTASDFYPENPRTLPRELAGRVWPPEEK